MKRAPPDEVIVDRVIDWLIEMRRLVRLVEDRRCEEMWRLVGWSRPDTRSLSALYLSMNLPLYLSILFVGANSFAFIPHLFFTLLITLSRCGNFLISFPLFLESLYLILAFVIRLYQTKHYFFFSPKRRSFYEHAESFCRTLLLSRLPSCCFVCFPRKS